MKRFIATLLISALLALSAASLPIFAQQEKAHNYLTEDKLVWSDVYLGENKSIEKTTENSETVYVAYGIDARYSSPFIKNIRPAIMEIMGDGDSVEITITFKVKAQFQLSFSNKEYVTSARTIFRCMETSKIPAEEWNEKYADSLLGAEAFFAKNNLDTTRYVNISEAVAIKDSEWVEYSTDIYLERAQVFSEYTAYDWMFGLDCLGGLHQNPPEFYDRFVALKFKDIGIYETEEFYSSMATPIPTATPTAVPHTETPEANPSATEGILENPEHDKNNFSETVIITVVCAVAVIGATATVIIIKKKKQNI